MHKEEVIKRRRPLYACHDMEDRAMLVKALEVFRELQTQSVRVKIDRLIRKINHG